MGKLERKVLSRGWATLEEYYQLKIRLTWYDKLVIWFKRLGK